MWLRTARATGLEQVLLVQSLDFINISALAGEELAQIVGVLGRMNYDNAVLLGTLLHVNGSGTNALKRDVFVQNRLHMPVHSILSQVAERVVMFSHCTFACLIAAYCDAIKCARQM